MGVLSLFYRLPRLTIITLLVVIAGGLSAMLLLPRQEDPTLIERFGYVLVTQPGATAEQMEALISEPLENALLELEEINDVTSISRAGVAQVSLDIREELTEAEVDDAWTLIRAQVEVARADFPDDASVPIVERLYVGANTMIISLIWEGEGEAPMAIMRRMALNLEDRLQRQSGTDRTAIFGSPDEEVRVVMDPDALAAAGLSFRQAAGLIAAADAKAPAGRLRSDGGNITLGVTGEFDSVARIRDVPLLQRPDGSALKVGDIADVRKGLTEPAVNKQLINNQRAILVGTNIATGQRVDQWAANAEAIVEEFRATAPANISVNIEFSQADYTSDRLNGLARNMMFSALIVFIALFLVMGWRAAIVVGLALPLTVCLVLILFNIFGHPLHQMSVTGLVISLGLLIDNAIVVVDEFDQKRVKGMNRLEAIDSSLRHLAAPLGASTLTTALAFAPIAMLPGSAGEFVGMIGLSVIFAIVSSFVLSMTVIPALAGITDRKRGWETGHAKRPHRWWRDGIRFNFLSDGYRATVESVLRVPPLGIAIGVVPAFIGITLAFGGTLPFVGKVDGLPAQFFPQTERDMFQLDVSMPPEASLADAEALTRRATDLLLSYEGVESVNWTIGEAAPRVYYNAFNVAQGVEGNAAGWVKLEDPRKTRAIVSRIQTDMRAEFPAAQFLALPYEQGPPADAPIEFFIQGEDLAVLDRLGNEARQILGGTPGVTYTTASLKRGNPTVKLKADEAVTAIAGDRLTGLAGDLNAMLEGVPAGSILEGTEELPVRVIAPSAYRSTLTDLRSSTIGAGPGRAGTPISALGEMTLEPETAVINRLNGQRVNQILAYLEPYTLAAPSFAIFNQKLEESGFTLPPGYSLRIGGEAENSSDATGNLAGLGIPLVLIMALAITLVFNSFRMMLLIMSSGFLAMGYAFFGVWLFNLPFGFNAIIGALGLLGISINGSIVVLSMLRNNEAAMADDIAAQRETVVDATRHIVATTLTTMGGFVPLLLEGDAFWMPFAAGIAGGVAGSALLALYYTPAMFRLSTWKPVRKLLTWIFTAKRKVPIQPAE